MNYIYYKIQHVTHSIYFRYDATLNNLLAITHEPDSLICDFQILIQERKGIDFVKWKESHVPGHLKTIDDTEFFNAYIELQHRYDAFTNRINFERIEQLNEKMATRHISNKSNQFTA